MTIQPEYESGDEPASAHCRADVLVLVDAGFRYAYSLTHHRQDSEDLVQQACLRVVRKQGSVVDKGYLFVTIRNLFRDRLRRQSLANFGPLTDDASAQDECQVRHIENQMDLDAMLGTVSSADRELIYLNCIEGFSAQEISEITGHPRGTILSRIARTKQSLVERFRAEPSEAKITS